RRLADAPVAAAVGRGRGQERAALVDGDGAVRIGGAGEGIVHGDAVARRGAGIIGERRGHRVGGRVEGEADLGGAGVAGGVGLLHAERVAAVGKAKRRLADAPVAAAVGRGRGQERAALVDGDGAVRIGGAGEGIVHGDAVARRGAGIIGERRGHRVGGRVEGEADLGGRGVAAGVALFPAERVAAVGKAKRRLADAPVAAAVGRGRGQERAALVDGDGAVRIGGAGEGIVHGDAVARRGAGIIGERRGPRGGGRVDGEADLGGAGVAGGVVLLHAERVAAVGKAKRRLADAPVA